MFALFEQQPTERDNIPFTTFGHFMCALLCTSFIFSSRSPLKLLVDFTFLKQMFLPASSVAGDSFV